MKVQTIHNGLGNDVTLNPSFETHFAFTGREYDDETGLYYYRARYYDPNIGRFLQVDPDSGRLSAPITHVNQYVYASNSPANNTDPSGRFSLSSVLNGKFLVNTMALTSPVIGGVVEMYRRNPKAVTRALMYTAIVGATIITGGVAPVLIGAAIGGTIGYFASGRNVNGALKGVLYGALGGGLGGAAAIAAGSSIAWGVSLGMIAGGATTAVGSRLIDGKEASWTSIAIGSAGGGFFGGIGASVPNSSAAGSVNSANSAAIGTTTDAAQGSYKSLGPDPIFPLM